MGSRYDLINDKVACVIMAGGKGTRLFPLTKSRCKPAVGFGGHYRLIDIPISNALNAHMRHIFVISQYFSSNLNNHIKETYRLDPYHAHELHLLNPEEQGDERIWYEGTADAVRKNLTNILKYPIEYFCILSGDQLYNMDINAMLHFAKGKDADLTIATLPVPEDLAPRMGLLKTDDNYNIHEFIEKPDDPTSYKVSDEFMRKRKLSHPYLASMGIYIFKRDALIDLLKSDPREDFGQHIIPTQMERGNVAAFLYDGYWEDIGTIESYYRANLDLIRDELGLNLYDEQAPIFCQSPSLPSPRLVNANVEHSVVCNGAVIDAGRICHSVVGLRSVVGIGSEIEHSILLGNNYYIDPQNEVKYEIGKNCLIKKAIIDENVEIGDNVKLINKDNLETYDGDGIFIRDGIIIVTSGTSIPNGFEL
ncbi:MAG: Glucose-1-phosphate adenylyltransferase [Chlamydiia bacterium]|nr:Glucose-1-phosphate adenylyltransferase [Chlamydiia bacterium]MCH9616271.1 Glucose-1-phosphate adenylyltransferase [Chlamydiia bacterium]MCH9629743.1 Glucose-1-phosphate adenylyltransferase [Chlamydiia bacterium]